MSLTSSLSFRFLLLPGFCHGWLTATESCSASSYLECRAKLVESLSQPTTHLVPLLDNYKKNWLRFDNERSCLCQNVDNLLWSPLFIISLFVFVGPRCPLCHLPLPWRQQLLRPNYSGLCDDVATGGCGSCHLLRPPPTVSIASLHAAHHACLVPRAAAGLHRRHPLLGLILKGHKLLQVPIEESESVKNNQRDERARCV